MSEQAFSSLPLRAELLSNLESIDYKVMTEIQAQALPKILANKDIIGQGKTGSGKTATFGLGILQKIKTDCYDAQALVLCPTRELADQVAKELRRLARAIPNVKILTLCGGTPFGPQKNSLERGAHIIVGTPGRIDDHLRKQTFSLDQVNTLVLDEADRMLDMGFQDTIDCIIAAVPKQRQTLLFSATYPDTIEAIACRIMQSPEVIKVIATHNDDSIEQLFFKVNDDNDRLNAIRLLLLQHKPESTVIFCNTKKETQEIADALTHYSFSAIALNGDLEQKIRDQRLVRFANKSVSILVATDVAARGLDIDALDMVINYQLSRDTEVHVHRIGRTGRAGSSGIACSLYTHKEDYKLALLGDYLGRTITPNKLPSQSLLKQPAFKAGMATLQIDGGKKQKVRPGDIVGALTGDNGIQGDQIGKIHVFDQKAYVAVQKRSAQDALGKLTQGKIKGKNFKARLIRG